MQQNKYHDIVLVVQLEQHGHIHIGMTPIKLHRPPDTDEARDIINVGTSSVNRFGFLRACLQSLVYAIFLYADTLIV